ncbi:MAG: hypothetical protein AAFX99_12755, partial [Myxococcota bacterium]
MKQRTPLLLLISFAALTACGDGGSSNTAAPQDTGVEADTGVETDTRTDEIDTAIETDTAVETDTETADVEPDVVEQPLLDVSERLGPGEVRVGIVEEVDGLIGGPKADGRLGDIKIYNSRVAFLIEGARRSTGGYRYWGGNIVDADVIRPEGEPGQDILGEIGHSWNLRIFQPESVEIVNNGANGEDAVVRILGRDAAFDWADSFIREFLNPSEVELEVVYEYRLAADAETLEHDITITNVATVDARVDLPLKLSNHGDGLRQWLVGSGFEFAGGTAASLDLASRDLSYSLIPNEGRFDLLFDYSNVTLIGEAPYDALAPNESATRSYRFGVNNLGSSGVARMVADVRADQMDRVAAQVSGTLEGNPEGAYVAATVDGAPVVLTPVQPDGSFRLNLPEGPVELTAWAAGCAPSPTQNLELAAGESRDGVTLALPEPAELTVSVVNSASLPETGALDADGDQRVRAKRVAGGHQGNAGGLRQRRAVDHRHRNSGCGTRRGGAAAVGRLRAAWA